MEKQVKHPTKFLQEYYWLPFYLFLKHFDAASISYLFYEVSFPEYLLRIIWATKTIWKWIYDNVTMNPLRKIEEKQLE